MIKIINIEGNIGSGKSTLLSALEKQNALKDSSYDILYFPEPTAAWDTFRVKDSGILELFYKDPAKYAFIFQMQILNTRYDILHRIFLERDPRFRKNLLILSERSFLSSDKVFSVLNTKLGNITEEEYSFYKYTLDLFTSNLLRLQPNLLEEYIFVNTDHRVCAERIKNRGRAEESSVPTEYLQEIQKHYKDIKMDYMIDGNLTTNQMCDMVVNYIKRDLTIN